MTLDEIRQILDLVREHELSEFELEQDGVKLRIRKREGDVQTLTVSTVPPTEARRVAQGSTAAVSALGDGAEAAAADEADGVELAVVKSPIVGIFYRSPEPSAPLFVNVGDTVRKNQVICIIEAMKLMNEIVSEYDGELVKVFAESGQPVQYGERLFAIRTT